MRVSTTDPISGTDVKNLQASPFVIEGRATARSRSILRTRRTRRSTWRYKPSIPAKTSPRTSTTPREWVRRPERAVIRSSAGFPRFFIEPFFHCLFLRDFDA